MESFQGERKTESSAKCTTLGVVFYVFRKIPSYTFNIQICVVCAVQVGARFCAVQNCVRVYVMLTEVYHIEASWV